ncbi:MAG: hypothetical protein ABSB18_00675 [Candidatus Omnitrophota bacterium]
MNPIAKIISCFFIIAIVILSQASCAKKEESKFLSYQPPAEENPEALIQKDIVAMKETVKHQDEFNGLYGYKAGRMNDMSVCDGASIPSQCRKVAQVVTDMKALAQGECGVFMNGALRNIDFCNHLKNGTCFMLKDWQKKLCEGLYEGDYNILKQILNDPSFRQSNDPLTEKGLLYMFSVYMGFKNNEGIRGCGKLTPLLTGDRKFICEIVFGTGDVNAILDSIAQDMATAYIARKYKSLNLCSEIKDNEIKSACFDLKVTTLPDWD